MIEPLDVGMVSVGASLFVEVVKLFGVSSNKILRMTSVLSAVVLMVIITLATPVSPATWGGYTLAIFGAMIAGITSGLAASKAYDSVKNGLDHQVEKR